MERNEDLVFLRRLKVSGVAPVLAFNPVGRYSSGMRTSR